MNKINLWTVNKFSFLRLINAKELSMKIYVQRTDLKFLCLKKWINKQKKRTDFPSCVYQLWKEWVEMSMCYTLVSIPGFKKMEKKWVKKSMHGVQIFISDFKKCEDRRIESTMSCVRYCISTFKKNREKMSRKIYFQRTDFYFRL